MTRDAEHTPSPQSVVVPVEPTEAMLSAAFDAFEIDQSKQYADGTTARKAIWSAMLAAAPAPSSLAGGEVSAAVDHLTKRLNKPGRFHLDDEPRLRTILAALSPEAPARATTPTRPVHIVRVSGATLDEQRAAVRQSETYQRGDTVLCWVNEGDLYANPSVVFEDLTALTPRHEAPAEEACGLCNGDCSAANPPVLDCPLRARSSAPGAREGEAVAWMRLTAGRITHLTYCEMPGYVPLYAHPAAPSADKLRIAVEALEPFNKAFQAYLAVYANFMPPASTEAEQRFAEGERKDTAEEAAFDVLSKVTFEQLCAVNEALAALKAEG